MLLEEAGKFGKYLTNSQIDENLARFSNMTKDPFVSSKGHKNKKAYKFAVSPRGAHLACPNIRENEMILQLLDIFFNILINYDLMFCSFFFRLSFCPILSLYIFTMLLIDYLY